VNRTCGWTVTVLLVCGTSVAAAQATPTAAATDAGPALRVHRFTVAAGLIVTGGYPLGDRTAEFRRNATGPPSPFMLFRADARMSGSTSAEGRVGFAVTRILSVEVGATYGKPQLAVTIAQDPEADGAPVVAEKISQLTIDVSGIYQISQLRLGSRARPYVMGGAGYLRQLHEDRLLVETGRIIHLGGGVRYWLRGGGDTGRAFGVRADVRFVHRTNGIDFEKRSRSYPVFSLLGFFGL